MEGSSLAQPQMQEAGADINWVTVEFVLSSFMYSECVLECLDVPNIVPNTP